MQIKPLAGKYYCSIIKDAKTLPSGIIIAEDVKEVPHKALVLAAGGSFIDNKGKTIAQSAKIGDIVHFKRVWHRELPSNRERIFVKEDEIVGVERVT